MNRRELRRYIADALRDCRTANAGRSCAECGYDRSRPFTPCRIYAKARKKANEILKLVDAYVADLNGDKEEK